MIKPKIGFTAKCYATYKSEIELPAEFFEGEKLIVSEDELLTYVRTHLDEAAVNDLEFLEDLEDITDSVWAEDLRDIVFVSTRE